MNNTEKLVLGFAIFVILTGVFLAISQYAKTIDASTMPAFLQGIVKAVQNFFAYSAVVFAVAYLRNILGYFRNWVTLHKTEAVDYDLNRYYNTLLYYVGPFNIALSALPSPYNAFGAALAFIVDVFTAEFKKIQTIKPTEPAPPYPPPIPATVLFKEKVTVSDVFVDGKAFPKSLSTTGTQIGTYQVATDETKEWKTSVTIAFADYNPHQVQMKANETVIWSGSLQYGQIMYA